MIFSYLFKRISSTRFFSIGRRPKRTEAPPRFRAGLVSALLGLIWAGPALAQPGEPGPRDSPANPNLISVQFTSDHALLRASENLSDWRDSLTRYPKPEWFYGWKNSFPISQTMGTSLQVNALVFLPSGTRFDLIGKGSEPYAQFEAKGQVATGALQTIALTAQAPLPANVAVLTETIHWSVIPETGSAQEWTMGPFKIYCTYGTPSGSVVTESRLNWCCGKADQQKTLAQVASKIWEALNVPQGEPPVFVLDPKKLNIPSPIWLLMASSKYNGQCIDLAILMQRMVQMLGGEGSIGYVYGSDNGDCFSTSPYDFEKRICANHGAEKVVVHSTADHFCVIDSSGWNNWEAVLKVDDTCYAVQLGIGSPLQILRQWLGPNLPCVGSDDYQCWTYWSAESKASGDPAVPGWLHVCQVPGPFPVPLPPES